jgi:hypothetical protein
MRLVRTILAFTVIVSLAMLPLGASSAGRATSSEDMQTAMHVAVHGAMSMDDCCPDEMKGTTSHKDGDKRGMGFCCIGGALALDEVRSVRFEFHPAVATRIGTRAEQFISARATSPPLRPPRV